MCIIVSIHTKVRRNMKYLTVLVLCVLATGKVTLQSLFGKKSVKTVSDAVFFNGLIFAFSAILFSVNAVGCSKSVWGYAALFALFTVLFQLTYTKALAEGNVSLTVLFVNLSMIFPVIVSAAVFNETISALRFVGILLTVISFFIGTDFKSGSMSGNWLFLTLCAMFANGGIAITQKVFASTGFNGEASAFVACSYIIAAGVSAVIYFGLSLCGKPKGYCVGKNILVISFLTGITLAVFQVLNTYAISKIDGTFLFPVYSGGSIILSAIAGIFLFRDKISKKQLCGIVSGIIAVIFMNF